MPLEPDLRLGQRAGLVGAQHVHRAEVLDRRQALDDDRCCAMRSAPRASVTEITIGSSSGVRPDRERHGEQERFEQRPVAATTLTSSTNSTSSRVSRMISMPKRAMPSSKAVGGGSRRERVRDLADRRGRPVAHDQQRAVPLTTDVPMNTALAPLQAGVVAVAARRRASRPGYDSPVSSAWLTKSRGLEQRPSAGTRSPAASSTTSPGTTCATGISRRAVAQHAARSATDCAQRARRPCRRGAPGRNRAPRSTAPSRDDDGEAGRRRR